MLFVVLPFVIFALPILLIKRKLNEAKFQKFVKKYWFPRGKHVLFVYSDSKNWKRYIEENILPRIKKYAIILNWSKRDKLIKSKRKAIEIFKFWAEIRFDDRAKSMRNRLGVVGKDYNPIAILFPKKGRTQVLRFYNAIKDYKHGKKRKLKELEKKLFDFISHLNNLTNSKSTVKNSNPNSKDLLIC